MNAILPFLPSIICAVIAGILALKGADGWGWFLLAAVVVAGAGVQA